MRRLVGFLLAFGATSAVAATLAEEARMIINPVSATDFEVVAQPDMAARAFWCGAASFIEVRQRQSELTPIYLKRPIGPSATAPGRRAVLFSTSAAGLPQKPDGLTVDVRRAGQMLKSFQARGFCRDAFSRATK